LTTCTAESVTGTSTKTPTTVARDVNRLLSGPPAGVYR